VYVDDSSSVLHPARARKQLTKQVIVEAERRLIASFLRTVCLSAAEWVEAVAYCPAGFPSPSVVILPVAVMMDRGPDGGHMEQAPGPAVATDGPVPVLEVDKGAADVVEEVRAQR
jgi:hypothetical protein